LGKTECESAKRDTQNPVFEPSISGGGTPNEMAEEEGNAATETETFGFQYWIFPETSA
jgi:hypothetical protein